MYLKSLEMHGFKSFPDKIKLDFDKGITAVVGPNGSGKSNIGDAVRWVLGEQSSKTLRGGKMEDVIFAGTQKRHPMGYASVTLAIKNDDKVLNIDSDEVAITRKLYRNGDSDYLINGTSARLKDITELFMDTGLGKDGYSIIGQGRIAEIVSAKSNERREIFEEAAGISKLRYRKAEAIKKLTLAQDNILRLNDIIGELEGRIDPLKKQSEKAEKFLLLAEKKKAFEITVWVNRLNEIKEKVRALSDKLLVVGAEYDNINADLIALEEQSQALYKQVADSNIELESLRNQILESERANTQLHSNIAVYQNDIAHCEENIASLNSQLESTALSESEYQKLAKEKLDIIAANRKACEKADADYIKAEEKLAKVIAKEDGNEKDALDKNNALNQLYISRSEYKITIESSKRSIDDIEVEKEQLKQSLSTAISSQEQLEKEQKEVISGSRLVEDKEKECENKIAGLTKLAQVKQAKYDKQSSELDKLSQSLRDKEQKVKILTDLENSMEGFAYAVKSVVKAGKQGRISGIIGTIAQLIDVPKEYSVAIETALGGSLQNIVTENEDGAKRGIRFLKETNGGRATFLPITSVKGNKLNENGLEDCIGYVSLAVDIIGYDKKIEGVITSILGRTVIAEDIDSATNIAKKYGYKFKIVTLDGQVINAGGSFTGGSINKTAGVLTRKNEIATLSEEINSLKSSIDEKKGALMMIKAEVDKLSFDIKAIEEDITLIKQDKVRFETEIKRINQLIEQCANVIKDNESAKENLDKKKAELVESRKTAIKELDKLEKNILKEEKRASVDSEQREALKREREELSTKLSDIRLNRSMLEKDIETLENQIKDIEEQSRATHDSNVKAMADITRQNSIIDEKKALILECEKKLISSSDSVDKINAKIRDVQQQMLAAEQKVNENRAKEKRLTAEKESLSSEKTRLDEKINSVQSEADSIVQEMSEQYELYPSEAVKLAITDMDKLEVSANLSKIKQEIKSLGNVNVAAIEEYKEVSERYEFLSSQLADVDKSKKELERIIDELTSNMKEKFVESFDEINKNFKEIFSELFGGGRAELILSDPENVLESGIEINVAPPGKVIKNLSLLSGGEQAFVAVAIYFSILKLKPSPFCILDEIEAALDEVNVTKYARYLRNFTDTTQFIAITHRRGTMEEADIMYGVTMQEKGVSKLLKLDQTQIGMTEEEM